jgi:hypothetical protein
VKHGSTEAVFIQAKRKGCGFVVGEANFLRALEAGLARDGIEADLAPLWLTPADAEAMSKEVRERPRQ